MHYEIYRRAGQDAPWQGRAVVAAGGQTPPYSLRMATPEQDGRQLIDAQPGAAGWGIQDRDEMNLGAGLGVAVSEYALGRDARRLDWSRKITTVVIMSGHTITVPATEANRSFSKLLRAARNGTHITITSHGEPVAELVPVGFGPMEDAERRRIDEAHDRLIEHLKSVKPRVVGSWTREELYDLD